MITDTAVGNKYTFYPLINQDARGRDRKEEEEGRKGRENECVVTAGRKEGREEGSQRDTDR